MCLSLEIKRVRNITHTEAIAPKDTFETNQPKRTPLVITYNCQLFALYHTLFTST